MPIYVGTNKIKSIYVGTTKIKKVYSGTTLVYSAEPSLYNGTPLVTRRSRTVSAKIGDYALIAGGFGGASGGAGYIDTVETYNTALVRGSASSLNRAKQYSGSASHPNYAMIHSGQYHNGTEARVDSTVCAYNSSLVQLSPATTSTSGRHSCGGIVGDYAVFIGGYNSRSDTRDPDVTVYDGALVKTILDTESYSYYNRRSASLGDKCIWAGGQGGGLDWRNTGRVINSSLVKSSAPLTVPRGSHGSATIGNSYALFAGGRTNSGNGDITSTVEAYDINLVKTTGINLKSATYYLSGGTHDEYAVFAGGYGNNKDTQLFNSSLVRIDLGTVVPINSPSITELGQNTIITAGIGATFTPADGYNIMRYMN